MSRCLPMGLLLGLGLGVACRAYAPTQPVEETGQACCTVADQALQHFEGCRITRGQCRARKDEKFWMLGRVTCGPVDEAGCAGGRCCSYLTGYGTEPAPAPDGSAPADTTAPAPAPEPTPAPGS